MHREGSTYNMRNQYEINSERHNAIYDMLVIVLSICFLMSMWWEETGAMNFLLMAIYFICTYTQFKERRYGCAFFYIMFFLFLLDTIFFGLFNQNLKYKFWSTAEERHILFCLGLAVVGVYLGAEIKTKFTIGIGTRSLSENNNDKDYLVSDRMQYFLRIAYLVCSLAELANTLAKVIFCQIYTYGAYYTDYTSPLPYFIRVVADISPLMFYFYLGTLPERKKALLPCGLYILIGVLALFYGQRNVSVVRFLIVLSYFLMRNNSEDEEWINKRQIMLLIVILPFVINFMSFWQSYRNYQEYAGGGIFNKVLAALLNQGNCISILDFEYIYRSKLPDKLYALGGIISFLHNNLISRLIGISSIPTQMHTVETALNGYSFGAALMYVENRNGYLLGFGIGSCYIAELYNSFGGIGVFIGSMIYGIVLRKLNAFQGKGFIVNGFVLYMFQKLLMAPRATYDGFISDTFQIANLFIAFVLWMLSKYVWPEDLNG